MFKQLVIALVLCAALTPVAASPWIARTSAALAQQFEGLPRLMQLADGDYLLALDEQDLSALQPYLATGEVRYISADDLLPETDPGDSYDEAETNNQPSPSHRLLALSGWQNFFENDGFAALDSSTRDCSGVTIAVLDSGVASSHPRFENVTFLTPYNAITDETAQDDNYGHGTHVAGLIGASNDGNWQGGCQHASLMPIRFLNSYGGGRISDAVKGIYWAMDNGADIINHSWTVVNANAALEDAMQAADAAGILQVVAAGNLGYDQDTNGLYPARYVPDLDGALAIANWDASLGELYEASNYGLMSVDLAASGTDLLSLAPGDGETIRTGTSMAAPLVSAAAAMLMTADPALDASAVHARLLAGCLTAASLSDRVRCGGRLYLPTLLASPAVAAFRATEVDGHVVLSGYGLDQVQRWQYQSWTDLQTVAVEAQDVTATSTTLAMPTSAGEWRLQIDGTDIGRFPYLPPLQAPTELSADYSDGQLLLAWNGSAGASRYRVEADIDFGGFTDVGSVNAPISQLAISADANQLVRLRVTALQDYWPGGQTSNRSATRAATSNVLAWGADTALWQTAAFAAIPVGANARLQLQLLDGADSSALALTAVSGGSATLDGTIVEPDTSSAGNLTLTLNYRDGDLTSSRQLPVTISATEYWQLTLDDGNDLLVNSSDVELQSLSLRTDGKLHLSVASSGANAMLTLRFASANSRFDSIQMEADRNASARWQRSSDARTLYLYPQTSDASQSFTLQLTNTTASSSASTSQDQRCFIASVALQHYPQRLPALRHFRDWLQQTDPGRWLVGRYYQYSPRIANYLEQHEALRLPVVAILWLLSWLLEYSGLALLILLLGLAGARMRRGSARSWQQLKTLIY